MLTITIVLRIIAALAELSVVALQKARPDQVQAVLDRHEKNMQRYEALLAKFDPPTAPETK